MVTNLSRDPIKNKDLKQKTTPQSKKEELHQIKTQAPNKFLAVKEGIQAKSQPALRVRK